MSAVWWLGLLVASASWELVSDGREGRVERRAGDDGLLEVRVETHSALPPRLIFAVLWHQEEFPSFLKHSKHLEILKDDGQSRVIYEQVKVPVISDRDYTTRCTYEADAATGLIQLFWHDANALGPPEQKGYVRIHHTSGSWTLEPTADGGSDVTYVVASETGGSVPEWIVRGAQAKAAPEFVQAILAQAARRAGR